MYTAFGPLFSLLRRVAPSLVTTTERLARAMLRIARDGAPKRVLEMSDLDPLSTP